MSWAGEVRPIEAVIVQKRYLLACAGNFIAHKAGRHDRHNKMVRDRTRNKKPRPLLRETGLRGSVMP